MRRLVRLVAACLLVAGTVWADDQALFTNGENAYKNKDFIEAEARFRAMVDPKSALHSPTLLDHAHAYLGGTLIELGKPKAEAMLEFKAVLLHNPDYDPQKLQVFPTKVLDAFVEARQLYKKEILEEKERREREEREKREREEKEKEKQRLYLAALEKQAGEQIETRTRNRLLTFVPFGVGQFQNGQNALGWTFFTGQLALLAGGAIAGGLALYNLDQYNHWLVTDAPNQNFFIGEYRARFNSAAIANYVFDGAFVLAAVAGIVQANFAFVPQTTTVKPRPLPKITFQMGAGTVGVEGTF
jgi:hypothetical protein